jgi:hypothetical protein
MQHIFLIPALLALSAATPLASLARKADLSTTPEVGVMCICPGIICPVEGEYVRPPPSHCHVSSTLIDGTTPPSQGCNCRNNNAQSCYKSWLAQGKACGGPPKLEDCTPKPKILCRRTGDMQCPAGMVCTDRPGDSCDPEIDEARNCLGFCVAEESG